MAYAVYDMDFDDVEAPCEFCEVLFPLAQLIEHQTGCEPELTSLNLVDVKYEEFVPAPIPAAKPQDVIPSEPVIERGDTLFTSHVQNLKIEIEDRNRKEVVKKETGERQTTLNENKQDEVRKDTKTQEMQRITRGEDKLLNMKHQQHATEEEFQKKGETLMVFGSAHDPMKDLENEKSSEEMEEVEDIEDINNLSDDDCKETLEDFWERATLTLKKLHVKNI